MVRSTGSSISSPSTTSSPVSLSRNAATMRRARSISSAEGEKTSLTTGIWSGWIAALPVKPSAAAARASLSSPSGSPRLSHGTSRRSSPFRAAAWTTAERA